MEDVTPCSLIQHDLYLQILPASRKVSKYLHLNSTFLTWMTCNKCVLLLYPERTHGMEQCCKRMQRTGQKINQLQTPDETPVCLSVVKADVPWPRGSFLQQKSTTTCPFYRSMYGAQFAHRCTGEKRSSRNAVNECHLIDCV